jgi:hypothetical protein
MDKREALRRYREQAEEDRYGEGKFLNPEKYKSYLLEQQEYQAWLDKYMEAHPDCLVHNKASDLRAIYDAEKNAPQIGD